MALAFFAACFGARDAAAALTFPLEAKWTANLASPPAFAPAFDADRMYVPLTTNQLVALLIEDGSSAWSVECPMSAAPAAGAGLVYAGSDGLIEARADLDGRARWRRPVTGVVTSLHWDAGWLFAQTEPGAFLAIRAADGEILWQQEFGSPLTAPPAASGDRVYLAFRDGRVMALTLQTGAEIWTYTLTESAVGILPVGDRVFVGSRDNQFYSLSASNASRDWRWRTGADIIGLPVLDARRVYFIAFDNILRGHHRGNGDMMWKRVLPVRPIMGPLLSGSTLIVSGVAAMVYGYDSASGKPIGNFELKGAESEEMLLAAPPHLTARDLLILLTKGGQVRAVGSQSAPAEAPAAPPTTPDEPPPDTGVAGSAPTIPEP